MATLLIILATVAAATSALIYPLRPKCTVAVSVVTVVIGASAYTLLLFGPKDYMLRIPSSIATLLHPWVLGGIGGLLLTLGVGGIIGFSARLLMSRKAFK